MIQTIKGWSLVLALISLGLPVLFNLEIVAQSCRLEAADPLVSVPAKQRPELIARLKLLVKYQGTRQWSKLYDLSIASIKKSESREAFVKHQAKLEPTPSSKLLSFTPVEAVILSPGQDSGLWEIFGCATYREKGRILRIKARVTAKLQNKNWFFSEVGSATQIDGPEEPCQ